MLQEAREVLIWMKEGPAVEAREPAEVLVACRCPAEVLVACCCPAEVPVACRCVGKKVGIGNNPVACCCVTDKEMCFLFLSCY